ncbi:hypothetical protein EKK58_04495 [Candidatus Dependentiae bacterium]|nr:MAG: hypothetical protein EKK58_04495 [Candidatus Dependentiae bacterium]
MKRVFVIILSASLFFYQHNNAYLYAHELRVPLIKQYITQCKKTKALIVKVILLLKKRERSYKALSRNLQKLCKVLFKK